MEIEKLLENWKQIDDLSKKKIDANFVSCTEEWEIEHIVRVLSEAHPNVSKEAILIAIDECCKSVKSPRPRKEFITCVVSKL